MEKFRSFAECDLQAQVEVGEESIVQNLDGPSSKGGAADVLGVSPEMNSSTLLKPRELTRRELLPVGISTVGCPVKRVAIVGFIVDELSEKLMGASQLMKGMRSDFGLSDRTVTSVGSVSTDIALSDIDALVAQ